MVGSVTADHVGRYLGHVERAAGNLERLLGTTTG